jgi:hypothetical protein
MAYAREATTVAPGFKVFPSTEAVLMEARTGAFAGCISATANLNADLCARAWRSGDAARSMPPCHPQAVRRQAAGSGVKALIAHIHDDAGWVAGAAAAERVPGAGPAAVSAAYDSLRGAVPGARTGAKARAASVPIPKFASLCGTLVCELRNQRDTSKSMILVRFGFEVPTQTRGSNDRNFKSTALV